MRKILFIQSVFDSGGVSKSLLNLLSVIDKKKYSADLLVFYNNGDLHDIIPDGINVLESSEFTPFLQKWYSSCIELLRRGFVVASIFRFFSAIVSRISVGKGAQMLVRILPPLKGEYDIAVDYGGQTLLYYMVDRVRARKKISFFHNDYEKWRYYEDVDRKYFYKVDTIFTVSKGCVEAMKRVFPEHARKILLMENISVPGILEKMSQEAVADGLSKDEFSVLTLGHVCKRKGSGLALETAKILKDRGVSFKWYFLGTCQDEHYYAELVKKLGLEDNVVFMGMRKNPYPYIEQCDLFVLPSKYEGKSIALDEAKLLCKPIVVTNFSTVWDQFEDRVNASICEMNPECLANAVKELLDDKSMRERYIEYLKSHRIDNSSNVKILYRQFDEI